MKPFQEDRFSVTSFAHAAVGFQSNQRLMAFFCYLDCGGSSTDKNRQKAISVGGYICSTKGLG
mgnify:CR=1 FL=1